ncbi:MAG: hypothetical protein VX899_10935 [Myxococcota bacterium]|nr:hypothetical protein [Myxococcota bacterium]
MSAQNTELFDDMLVGQESVITVLGAPGPRQGALNVWYQVALTDYRIFVIKMTAADGAAGWATDKRWAMNRDTVAIGQYPRTTTSDARLEIEGFPEPIHLVHIDRQDLHPHIRPFLLHWGRQIQGVSDVAPQPIAEGPTPDGAKEKKEGEKLILILAGAAALLILCCGGSVLIRTVLSLVLG